MAIDLEREAPITLAEAPKLIPAINAVPGMEARQPLHQRTIYNWATRGKRGVILETVPVGGILVTTRQAIQRFFGQLALVREQRRLDSNEQREATRRGVSLRRRNRNRPEYKAAVKRLAEDHGI